MDKVSILTASRVEPNVLPYSTEILVTSLSPILQSALQLQRIISAVTLQVLFQAYAAACITFNTAVWSSKFLAVNGATFFRGTAWASGHAVWWMWTSKGVVALRDQTFRNFATWILGSGNGLILMVFWPGWWFLAGTSCAVWVCWV